MKTLFLLLAISLGILFPYGYEYTFLIRYFLMIMLFFSFLDVKIEKEIIRKTHFVITAAIITASIAVYFLLKPFSIVLAQAAFITAIAPTAIAAPVIISLKKKNVEYVTFSLLLNNVVIALIIPFLLSALMQNSLEISVIEILVPVIITLLVPFVVSQAIKFILPSLWKKLVGWKDSSFYILILNIYIASSDASHYIRSELTGDIVIIFYIALTSALLCAFFFLLGWIIGGKEFPAEASQSLGQKNNAFTIWIALTFINPITAIGPVFYVFVQNLYISWELYRHHATGRVKSIE